MSRGVECLISGKKFIFNPEYYAKRVEEYGDEESLKKFFVTKKVKSLINRGYTVQEIRNILDITDSNILDAEDQSVKEVMVYHNLKASATSKRTSCNFATHKSDEDVSIFINNIRDINYD